MQEAERKHKAHLAALSAFHRKNPLTSKTRDSIHTAPGWRTIDILLSCIPDPMYPWNPEVVKKLWELDKRMVPMWIRYIMKEPADWGTNRTVVIGRHAVGLVIDNPNQDIPIMKVSMPSMPCRGITLSKPRAIEAILQSESTDNELPGDYQPFNMKLFYILKAKDDKTKNLTAKELAREIIEGEKEASAKKHKELDDTHEYIMKDIRKLAQKKLDQLSEVEARDQLLAGRQRQSKSTLDLGR